MNKRSPEVVQAVEIIMAHSSGAVFPVKVPHRYRAATFRSAIRRYLPIDVVKRLSLEGRILWVKRA